ncbi:hypothetical protein QGX23_gp128 [Pseudomonas phage PN09]|uniref:Uncharacterized protein n=1 Tax=Pseudomonas phage PN09 TaxID=2782564 RepID=A0A7S7YBY5_9CAUD|nr:hypothetical protein QGX23_gp128 [Pseudomonas phage PN09]QPB10524.1 hypothetical protein PN09_103 [Pseudomonas phage PN09]
MESFNNRLEVGMLAMIIGCSQPENSSIIGKIVTVECLTQVGDNVRPFYEGGADPSKPVVERSAGMVFATGVDAPKRDPLSDNSYLARNTVRLRSQFLMPLPPLPEEELQKEKELELA